MTAQIHPAPGHHLRTWPRRAWRAMTLLATIVALVSFRYLFGKGPVPPNLPLNPYFHPWLVIHATGAATALLVGSLQFLPSLRQRLPAVHRAVGRVYVAACLVGGVSALVLAPGVSAGPVAGAGFGALGIAWLVTTAIAVRRIVAGDVAAHRRWMVRSFALTLAAVALRLYLPLSSVLGVEFLLAYRVIAWLCWVPNLLLAQWYLARRTQPS
ncbi:hypothetical protein ASF61_04595 [Duganella sp. Leaf126]|uniref:DUF2306 domain-containing protein n=1 Tax=Duganella sp. Leaf126 TaxID=1736266 RepID=UPI00070022E4|nr:DUF2306 domain-containing protein [Duganella sp. Leaf126]KQQ40084.1 hypothetical protein ASF61_04595 [Duganella sp. Leaf126]